MHCALHLNPILFDPSAGSDSSASAGCFKSAMRYVHSIWKEGASTAWLATLGTEHHFEGGLALLQYLLLVGNLGVKCGQKGQEKELAWEGGWDWWSCNLPSYPSCWAAKSETEALKSASAK